MAGAASRYAKALYEALEARQEVAASLPLLQGLAVLPSDLLARLADPTTSISSRRDSLLAALGQPASGSVLERFVSLLGSRRRLGLVARIAQEALSLHDQRSGVVNGTVVSSSPLSPNQVERLAAALSAPGRQVRLDSRTDSGLLGGFRVRIGDTVLDATADNQLNQARRALLSA